MSKFNIFLAVSLLFVGMACSSDNSDDPAPVPTPTPTPTPTQGPDTIIQIVDKDTCLLVNKSAIVDASGGECVMVIRTNRSHTLSTTYNWITIKEQSRGVSDCEHTLVIAANSGGKRDGDVKVKFEGTEKATMLSFKVTQAGSGTINQEYSFIGGINDMTQNDWEQNEMNKTDNRYINRQVDIYTDDNEVTLSIAELGTILMTNAGYGGVVLDDIKSGVLGLMYEGGYYSEDMAEEIRTNELEPKDALLPAGFSYGIAVSSDGRILSKGNNTSSAALIVGTNDFQELKIKVNKYDVAGRVFAPSIIVTGTNEVGDKCRVHICLFIKIYHYPKN